MRSRGRSSTVDRSLAGSTTARRNRHQTSAIPPSAPSVYPTEGPRSKTRRGAEKRSTSTDLAVNSYLSDCDIVRSVGSSGSASGGIPHADDGVAGAVVDQTEQPRRRPSIRREVSRNQRPARPIVVCGIAEPGLVERWRAGRSQCVDRQCQVRVRQRARAVSREGVGEGERGHAVGGGDAEAHRRPLRGRSRPVARVTDRRGAGAIVACDLGADDDDDRDCEPTSFS